MFFKIGVLKKFANFTEKHLCWTCKLACNFIKKRLQHRYFPVKYVNFFRTAFFTEHLRWLLIMFSVRKLLQHVVIHFAIFSQPVNRNQVFSISKHIHEQRHEQANLSIRHKRRKDRSLIKYRLSIKIKRPKFYYTKVSVLIKGPKSYNTEVSIIISNLVL